MADLIVPQWLGEPGHFVCASHCRWRLHTHVGQWCISSVGEHYVRGATEMEIMGSLVGYAEGEPRMFYETMVTRLDEKGEQLWPEEDGSRYHSRAEAAEGHQGFVIECWAKAAESAERATAAAEQAALQAELDRGPKLDRGGMRFIRADRVRLLTRVAELLEIDEVPIAEDGCHKLRIGAGTGGFVWALPWSGARDGGTWTFYGKLYGRHVGRGWVETTAQEVAGVVRESPWWRHRATLQA